MITENTLIYDALKQGDPNKIAEVLQSYGMHCFGCAIARGETIAQAAEVHGVDVKQMIEDLNKAI